MSGFKIGIGPSAYGIRKARSPGQVAWHQFLDDARAVGFDGVELGTWGYLPLEGKQLSEELRARHLELAAGALIADFAFGQSWSRAEERARLLCDLFEAVGTSRLVLIDAPTEPDRSPRRGQSLEPAAWAQMIDRVNAVARYSRRRGIMAAFHPHADTIVQTDAEIEKFLADTDPALVGLCFDTAHYAYFMGDPVAFINSHGDRIKHVHIKNVDAQVRSVVLERQLRFPEAVQLGVMTDLPSGLIDFSTVFDALAHGAYDGWVVVEHDLDPNSAAKPYEVALKNRQFLSRIGV